MPKKDMPKKDDMMKKDMPVMGDDKKMNPDH
jgi:hypothetical protein